MLTAAAFCPGLSSICSKRQCYGFQEEADLNKTGFFFKILSCGGKYGKNRDGEKRMTADGEKLERQERTPTLWPEKPGAHVDPT